MTAPWENPPNTVRSGGTSNSSSSGVEPGRRPLEGREKRVRIRVADLLDRVPVRSTRWKCERPAGKDADEACVRVQDGEKRLEIELVRAAAVHEDERPARVSLRLSDPVRETCCIHGGPSLARLGGGARRYLSCLPECLASSPLWGFPPSPSWGFPLPPAPPCLSSLLPGLPPRACRRSCRVCHHAARLSAVAWPCRFAATVLVVVLR